MTTTIKFRLIILFALAGIGSGVTPARAQFPLNAMPVVTNTVRYRLSVAANTSTSAVVIDLHPSTATAIATAWPHKERRELNISSIRLELDKVAASTCSVKLGVVNYVNASTGSVTWFYTKSLEVNVSNTDVMDFLNYNPNYLRLRVEGAGEATEGNTPYLLSSEHTVNSTIYQNDLNLPCPLTTGCFSTLGSLVMAVQTGGATVVNLEIQYSSDK